MIDLYSWKTPNGRKVSIMLEEVGLPYEVHPINLAKGEQFAPEYLALNPNNKIPTIVDGDGPEGKPYTLFESGAILMYLAEKAGALWPSDPVQQALGRQWLFWQMSYVGPMMGQLHHFVQYAPEKLDYPIARYTQETERLRRMLNRHLEGREYILDDYSIADIACLPWFKMFSFRYPNQAPYPNLEAWMERLFERDAVQRGFLLDIDKVKPVVTGAEPVTDEVRRHLFASYQRDDGPTG